MNTGKYSDGKCSDRNRYAFCRKGDSLTWKQNVLQYMKTA